MRNAPTNWNTLMAQTHEMQVRIDMADTSFYGFDDGIGIWSLTTSNALFNGLSVGNCFSGQIDLVLAPGEVEIPKMAKMEVLVRLTNGTINTPWVSKGTYFIDAREWDFDHKFLTITGYDAMLKCNVPYLTTGSVGNWPRKDNVVVSEICTRIGVSLDTRTVLNKSYDVQLPAVSSDGSDSDTVREVLGWIGAMYGGNWIINDDGKLQLIPLVPTRNININKQAVGLTSYPAYDAIGTIHLVVSETAEYVAGTGGRSIEIQCPWGTQAMANNLLTALQGYIYRPVTITTVYTADALWELGDGITVNSIASQIASVSNYFAANYSCDIEAPNDEEIDHEYPYESTANREIKREIAKTVASIKVDVDSITLSVTPVTDPSGQSTGATTFTLKMGSAELSTDTVDLHVKALNVDGTLTADKIKTGTLDTADLNLNGILHVVSGESEGGYIGFGNGNDGTSTPTDGVVMSSTSKDGYGSGDHYIICTNKGVRMQSGDAALYCAGDTIHKVIGDVDTELGEAVFG